MIIKLEEANAKWDEFLFKNHHLVFHIPEWKKFIESAFSTRVEYIAAEENDKIEFILPIGLVKSSLFGNRLISMPYLEYGGFAGNPKHIKEVIEYIKQNYSNYDYLQIRESVPEKYLIENGFKKSEDAKRFVLTLEDHKILWEKLHKMKRKAVRHAQSMNVTVKDIPVEQLDELYSLYLDNMKRFGSPPYSKKYFESFYEHILKNNMGKCLGAYLDNKLIAFLLGFTYQNRVHITTSVSYTNYLDCRPNDILHWEFIKWASENNFKVFDFGIVKENTGHYSFKEKWNTELKPLNNYYLFLRKNEITNLDHTSSKYKTLESIWNKMPNFLANSFGPKIREGLGI